MTTSPALFFTLAEGQYFFNPDEIVRLEASSNYTRIFFANKTTLVSAKVLKVYEAMLEPFGFVRTHRTHLVNRTHISRINAGRNVIMKDLSVVEISRRMKTGVLKTLTSAA
jgi:two-component system, LytTR family, response regulator